MDKGKVILLDYGLFLHRSLFGWEIQRKKNGENKIPATYTCMAMILSNLAMVGVKKEDTVIVTIDGRGNWRRDYDENYKANRKELKEKDEIDWNYWYKKYDELIESLKKSTNWSFIRINKLECDDIISVAVRHFKDRECVIVSCDGDFDQLCALPNVKIFSPITKKYKVVDNPYKSLASKIKKESTDNLVSPLLDEADFDRRYSLVNLMELPKDVEEKVIDEIKKISYNITEEDFNHFPFKSLVERYKSIYNSNRIISYEKCVKAKIKKIKKKKRKVQETNVSDSPKIEEW